MRALVVSIWVFINLVFFGMCGYMYLLWSQYWMYNIEGESVGTNSYNYDRQIYYYNRGRSELIDEYVAASRRYRNATITQKKSAPSLDKETSFTLMAANTRPRFPNLQSSDFRMDNAGLVCQRNDTAYACGSKITEYKEQLLRELRRVSFEESNVLREKGKNPYNVTFSGQRQNAGQLSVQHLLCRFKKVKVDTIARSDHGASGGRESVLRNSIPKRGLFEGKRFERCAVVSSAGSLLDSNLGPLIDSHDVVLRFNGAPVDGFEKDVGRKTTLRVLNSQVVTKPQFDFLHSHLYKNVTLLAWDPGTFGGDLRTWFRRPEHDLFRNYVEFRRKNRRAKFYIVNPRSVWDLWTFLQSLSPDRLRRNPPSSGFLGLAVLLPYCSYVHMFEYIPSTRITKRCHYYDQEDNPACTFGVWHPLAAEKLLAYSLNVAGDDVVFRTGYIKIPGFRDISSSSC